MGDDGISELEKQRRNSRARKWTDPATGMGHIDGQWDPIRAEAIHKAIDREIAARVAAGARNITPRQQAQLAAEALHALIVGKRVSNPESAAVMVLIDYDTLAGRVADDVKTSPEGKQRTSETQGGTPLPAETIRRIACDAGIIPIVLGGKAKPSMSAANGGSPPGPNAWRSEPNTPPAPWTKAATSPSTTARSTTSTPSPKAETPTSTACAPDATTTTTSPTKAAGPSPATPTAPGNSTHPNDHPHDCGRRRAERPLIIGKGRRWRESGWRRPANETVPSLPDPTAALRRAVAAGR